MRSPVDTIVAIATPPGRGGIGVVRLSGDGVPALIEALIGRPLLPRLATLATFRAANGDVLDQGLALHFPAPHSYTGEHVLELQGHGGPAVMRLLLQRCVELGAALAAPGEFTQRAFLNGKLDLAQAEGVADLIDAATATAARAAARSLSGAFSRAIRHEVEALVELRMLTEATLDFPEEDIDFLRRADATGRLARIRKALADIDARARQGALLRDGLTMVIVGQPNVGKSSLLNQLAGEDVAIVTPLAGTTRDTVRSQVELAGVPVTVIDTAGLRPTDDPVETLGIERAWGAVAHADLVLVLVDARDSAEEISAADAAILAELPAALARIVVHNKIDLTAEGPREALRAPSPPQEGPRHHVWLSAKTGAGVALLRQAMLAAVGRHEDPEGSFLARARHLAALDAAAGHLAAAAVHIESAAPPLELFAEELREAQSALSAITGEFTADDLLGAIFSRFCIGK
jgi:tRNA modification GTPase